MIKVIQECQLRHTFLMILQMVTSVIFVVASSWWNIALSITPITVGINDNNNKNCINHFLFFVFLVIIACEICFFYYNNINYKYY